MRIARTYPSLEILHVTTRVLSTRRVTMLVIASVVCLTLLFSAQDAMRRGVNGAPVNWSHVIAINALDWVGWALLLPLIVAIGRRIRLDGSGRRPGRIIGWVLLAVGFCVVQASITGLVIRLTSPAFFGIAPPPGANASPRPLGLFLVTWTLATSSLNLLIFGMTAGVFHALIYYRDIRARQLRESELQSRLAHAELNVLRTQLQPHFLFNALHTVSSLMVSDVPSAQRVVSALGDLLRSALDHTAGQEIRLRDELAFVQRYVDIQRARFRNRLLIDVDVPDSLGDALVPSLVLQPLVENAIRHGIEPSAEGGRIWIRAARRGGEVALTVENEGIPNDSTSNGNGSRSRGGVGLANLEARLAQLYGSAHAFRADWNGDGRFTVTLRVPFHTDASLFPAPERVAGAAE
jgi:signal transduction histidine kinase